MMDANAATGTKSRGATWLFLGMLLLSALAGCKKQPEPDLGQPWIDAWAAQSNSPPVPVGDLADADIPKRVDETLAQFDRTAAAAKPEHAAHFASVRRILAFQEAADLRAALAIMRMGKVFSTYADARNPEVIARIAQTVEAAGAAVKQRFADDEAIDALVAKEAQAAHFSAAQRQGMLDANRMAARKRVTFSRQLSAIDRWVRAQQSAYQVLASSPGDWRIEDGRVRFSNGLVAADFSAAEREVADAARQLDEVGLKVGSLEPSGAQ